MASTGLLLLSNITKAQSVFVKATKYVKNVLYIKVNGCTDNLLSQYSRQIVNLYTNCTLKCDTLDVRLILRSAQASKDIRTLYPIELVLYDSGLSAEIDDLKHSIASLTDNYKLQKLDVDDDDVDQLIKEDVKAYKYVALGGTFDRLHNGHKILLSEAALRTTKELTVGVTDVNMIQSKILWELIQPLEVRMNSVRSFLSDINPEISYNITPLQDIYGPTKDDIKLQMIVVSEETIKGAKKINEVRRETKLKELEMYVINLASECQMSSEEESKVSSSNRRMRELGTLRKPPVPNPSIPDEPYVIGLAGGIASGKTKIVERLQRLGAGVVNCDLLAHELYKPGLPLNRSIAEAFGKSVMTEDGEVNRRVLGDIVFNDPAQLEKLNGFMWPAILSALKERIRTLGLQGSRVVVVEAAVLVTAGWYKHCHQLWAVIVPPHEAIKRIQERNNLSEEQARQRVMSQPSNAEQVEHANIVFSPFWSYEFTQSQVERAWNQLQRYLTKNRL